MLQKKFLFGTLLALKRVHNTENRPQEKQMNSARSTKKIMVATALTSLLALSGVHSVTASPGTKTPAMQPCPRQAQAAAWQADPATIKARTAFMNETRNLRKAVAEKRAAMRAIMNSENPDPAKTSKIAGEIFDLREQIRAKAVAAGLPPRMLMGMMGMAGRDMHKICDGPMHGVQQLRAKNM
jgi:zinc resistance-associated protein